MVSLSFVPPKSQGHANSRVRMFANSVVQTSGQPRSPFLTISSFHRMRTKLIHFCCFTKEGTQMKNFQSHRVHIGPTAKQPAVSVRRLLETLSCRRAFGKSLYPFEQCKETILFQQNAHLWYKTEVMRFDAVVVKPYAINKNMRQFVSSKKGLDLGWIKRRSARNNAIVHGWIFHNK